MNAVLDKWKRLPTRLIYGLICLASLAFMIWKGEDFGFWWDEMAQLTYSGAGKTLLESALIIDPTPPLFNVVANIWYNITPYGQRWLLLLPQLATVLAVYVSALWAQRLGGRRVGIWTAVLLAFSRMVITHCGFEFRSYGFYLLFAALAFYSHSLLMETGNGKPGRRAVFYWFSLLGLVYSHIMGAVLFFVLAAQDMILILRRRIPWTRLFIYFFAGILFLPWFFYILSSTGNSVVNKTASWMPKPKLWSIVDLCGYLCGNQAVVCVFFACGGILILVKCLKALKKKELSAELEQILVPCLTAALMIFGIFIYGCIRSSYASLWSVRYFTGLYPCFAVVAALGADAVSALLEKKSRRGCAVMNVLCFTVIVSVYLGRVAMGDLPVVKYYHREATEIMYSQPDIHDENTLVMCIRTPYLEGWEDFYCTQKGQREPLGIRGASTVSAEELREYDVVYYEYGYGRGSTIDTEARRVLEEEYVIDQAWEEYELRRYVKK